MSMTDTQELLYDASRIAHEAGDILNKGLESYRDIHFQDSKDIKLEADQASETLIREFLSAQTGLPIIGEEQGGDAELLDSEELFWVVDPLDGTYNYLRQSSQCCVSIGLMRGADPIGGVIYDFNTDTMFAGSVGAGIAINGEPHKPQWVSELKDATLASDIPTKLDLDDATMAFLIELFHSFNRIRMIGSAALAMANVAAGRVDVYHEKKRFLWDIAAGTALVRAAGGHVFMDRVGEPEDLTFDMWAMPKAEWKSEIFSRM